MSSKSRVLIIDDSAQMVDTVSQYLASYGFDPITSTNASSALDRFHREPVQAVLTDLRMTGLDGLDVLDEVHRADPGVPVIIMTAFGSIESAVEAVRRGAFNYLTKPFALGSLRAMLNRAIGGGPQRAAAAPAPRTASATTDESAPPAVRPPPWRGAVDPVEAVVPHALTLRELQERYIAAVLRSVGGNRSRAARILGVDPSTLYRREVKEKD